MWVTAASTRRVSHADVWRKIVTWVEKFEDADDQSMEFVHVRAPVSCGQSDD